MAESIRITIKYPFGLIQDVCQSYLQLSKDLGWLRAQRSGTGQPSTANGKQKRLNRIESKGRAAHASAGRIQKHGITEQGNAEQGGSSCDQSVSQVKPVAAPEGDPTFPEVQRIFVPQHKRAVRLTP
jgi:hypothetical protein